MAARPWLRDLLNMYFPTEQTVSLDLLVQALTARLYPSSVGAKDQHELREGLNTILGRCAKEGEPTNKHESSLPFSKAYELGLDDYLGHDIEPTIMMESAAYPTPVGENNAGSSKD